MATKKKSTAIAKKAVTKSTSKKAQPMKGKAAPTKETAKKTTGKAAAKKKVSVAQKSAATQKKAAAPKNKDEKRTKTATVKKETNVEKKVTASKKGKEVTSHKTAASKAKKDVPPAKKSVKSSGKAENNGIDKSKETSAKSKSTGSGKSTSAKKDNVKPKFVYKPEPSILDIPRDDYPRKRYSDNELQEFKVLIQGKLEAAHKELVYLQGLITRKDEAGTDDTENKYMGVEDGGGTMEREQLSQLASRQIQFIDKLEKALQRIENKTYGICRETGKLIDKARLRAVPHATLSIEAKLAKKR